MNRRKCGREALLGGEAWVIECKVVVLCLAVVFEEEKREKGKFMVECFFFRFEEKYKFLDLRSRESFD